MKIIRANLNSIFKLMIIQSLQYLTGELDAIDSVLRASLVAGSPVEVKLLETICSRNRTSSQSWSTHKEKNL